MTSLASQVVLHPSLSQALRVEATTLGRDKTYRFVQYFARFYAWYLLSRGEKDAGARWNALKAHLGLGRKLLRLGKPLEHLQAALKASFTSDPALEQITAIARQIAYFGFLSFDGLVWATSVKFLKLDAALSARIAKIANRFWLAGILFSLVHGIAKSARFATEAKRLQRESAQDEKNLSQEVERQTRKRALQTARTNVRQQLIMDCLDIWIPATGLELTHMNEGVLGIFGMITSYMALQKQWAASADRK